MQFTTPSLLAVATGIVGSAWSSGCIASLSIVGIPAALISPTSPAVIWAELFGRGVAIMPKFAATTAAAYLYAAYDTYQREGKWKGFVAGAVLTISIVPYTLAFMSRTNALLHAAAAGTSAASLNEVKALMGKWASLNLGGSMLPLAGTVIGLASLFQNVL